MFFKNKKIELKNKIGFYWMDDDFFSYAYPENIMSYPYTLSIFEMEEKSFDSDVTKLFVEIADSITKGNTVLHIPEREIPEFSCLGIKKELFQQQIDEFHGWDETELFCYFNYASSKVDKHIECDLYFMVDLIHANMTIKCRDKDLFQRAKDCMNEIIGDMNYNLEKWESLDS